MRAGLAAARRPRRAGRWPGRGRCGGSGSAAAARPAVVCSAKMNGVQSSREIDQRVAGRLRPPRRRSSAPRGGRAGPSPAARAASGGRSGRGFRASSSETCARGAFFGRGGAPARRAFPAPPPSRACANRQSGYPASRRRCSRTARRPGSRRPVRGSPSSGPNIPTWVRVAEELRTRTDVLVRLAVVPQGVASASPGFVTARRRAFTLVTNFGPSCTCISRRPGPGRERTPCA